MALIADRPPARPIHPIFAFLLAGTVPLFLGALLSDWTYANSPEPQWANLAAWLLVGAMVLTALAFLAAITSLFRAHGWGGWRLLVLLLLLAAFILGLVDCFVHARDAYGIIPEAPLLSAIATLVVVIANIAGFSSLRARDVK